MSTPYPRVGVGVILVNHQGQVLLGKRKGSHAPYWSIAGGHLELGESFESAAIREVAEETGFLITNPSVIAVTNNLETWRESGLHYISVTLLAEVEGAIAGCCALRPLDTADYPNASEMKRLFVRKAFRGFGLWRELAKAMLDHARRAGYACVLLDTLDDMESARALYTDLGFAEIPPYYHNPIAGAHYLKVDIF